MTTATRAGAALATTTGDATSHHVMINDGRTGIIVKNTGSTVARTVTFRIAQTVDGQAVAPRTATLAAGEQRLFGPFDVNSYGGKLEVDVDHTELTLTPVRMG
ncbi:hypothetical protein [Streptomyces sp. DH12]|uniref:hypothetical protein n=1 Tax=Streptomyces sp. DH12 TaxID=2857010 RepID=UPI001E44A208|nr:hypothetical protein [Streptomyces sp. DH12]